MEDLLEAILKSPSERRPLWARVRHMMLEVFTARYVGRRTETRGDTFVGGAAMIEDDSRRSADDIAVKHHESGNGKGFSLASAEIKSRRLVTFLRYVRRRLEPLLHLFFSMTLCIELSSLIR